MRTRGQYDLASRCWLPTDDGEMDLRVYVNENGVETSLLVAWPEWVVSASAAEQDRSEDDDEGESGDRQRRLTAFLCPLCEEGGEAAATGERCPHCEALQGQEAWDPARIYRLARLGAIAAARRASRLPAPRTAGTGGAPDAETAPAGDTDAAPPARAADPARFRPALVRMHDACATSELFGSVKCDCAQQLRLGLSLARAEAGAASVPGAVVYLPQEGRGIGLAAKAAAYALQAAGADTVDANRLLGLPDDARCYDGARDALWDSGLALQPAPGVPAREPGVRLLSNNPRKRAELERLGVRVAESLPHLAGSASPLAMDYLRAKADRMGHTIPRDWLRDAE